MFNKGNNIYNITNEALSKDKLMEKLEQSGVELNDYAYELFQSDLYKPSTITYTATVVELTLAEIGLTIGGNFGEIRSCIQSLGLLYCPLELASYIRLHKLHDKELSDRREKVLGKAPPGSITIFSEPLVNDDDFPKGFYIRTINGVPWLRGYRCSEDYVWDPGDRMIFTIEVNVTITL